MRAVAVALCLALLLTGSLFLIFRHDGMLFARITKEPLAVTSLETVPDQHNPQLIRVVGSTNLPSEVALIINDLPYQKKKVDAQGNFAFDRLVVAPGEINVQVVAGYMLGGRETLAIGTQRTLLTTGQMLGTIKDVHGQPIKDADITVVNRKTNEVIPVELKESGKFLNTEVPQGEYVIRVRRSGFRELESGEIRLEPKNGYRFNGEIVLAPLDSQSPSRLVETVLAPRPRVYYYDSRNYPRPLKRMVEADVKYRRLDWKLQGTLPTNDQRLALLNCPEEERQKCLGQFVKLVFGDFGIKGRPIYLSFKDDDPSPKKGPDKDGQTDFSLASLGNNYFGTGSLRHEWSILTAWDSRNTSTESFHLKLEHYELDKKPPDPYFTDEKHDVTWTTRKDFAPPELGVTFTYELRGLSALLRLVWTTPYDLVPGENHSILYYLWGSLVAVPLLWLIWFLQQNIQLRDLDNAFAMRLQRAMPTLVAVPMIDPVMNMMRRIAGGAFNVKDPSFWQVWLHKIVRLLTPEPSQDDIRVILISILILVVVFGVLTLIMFPVRRIGVMVWILNLLLGTFYATMIVLFFATITGLALLIVPYNVVGLSQILSALIAGAFSIWIVFYLRFYRSHVGRPLKMVLIGFASIWVLTAIHGSFSSLYTLFSGAYEIPEQPKQFIAVHNEVLINLRVFFRYTQLVIPYFGLLGVMLLLKKRDVGLPAQNPTDDQSDGLRPIIYSFGLIVFTAFLVGTQLTWLLLPLPFALSFVAFRLVLMSEPRRKAFDRLLARIVAERFPSGKNSGWKAYVLGEPEIIADRKRLKNIALKHKAGDILDKDYLTEKEALETRIKERDALLDNAEDGQEVVAVSHVAFGVGPAATNWANAAWAVQHGIRLALPLLAIEGLYVWVNLKTDRPFFEVSSQILLWLAYWLTAAWFFGYYFNWLRGRTGLSKGAYLSAAVTIPMVLSTTGLKNFAPYIVGSFYFFSVLGAWAFDYHVVQRILGNAFKWPIFIKIENSPSWGSIGTLFTSAFGTVVSAVIVQILNALLLYLTYQSLPPWFKA